MLQFRRQQKGALFDKRQIAANTERHDKAVKHSGRTLREQLKSVRRHRNLLLMLIPGFVLLILFSYVPMYGITLAFKDYNIERGILGSAWVGLKYFERFFSTRESIGKIIRNTLVISGLKIIFSFPAPILFALLLNEIRRTKFKRVVQTISYLPNFLSWIVVSALVFDIFTPGRGIIAAIMRALGMKPIPFLYENAWFLVIVVISDIWKGVGWGAVIYLASISAINVELYDAATVDGAGRLQQARYITLPGLVPVITILFILTMGSLFNAGFDQVFNLYNPAVYEVADILDTYIYRRGITEFQFSMTTAVGIVRNVMTLMLIIASNMIVKKFSEYAIW